MTTVFAIALITALAFVLGSKMESKGMSTDKKPDETSIENVSEDGWMEYIFENRWVDREGHVYNTKEECLEKNEIDDCVETKFLVDTIWHDSE